ncbi:MAG: methyltransferase domain-containing protein [Synechococcaceae cyanobacterium]|nr:methyltransferase domain-containing protein [Synechococcaceae cyanobacterium]
MSLVAQFIEHMARLERPSILELGTCQSVPGRSTMHRDWVPHAGEFLGSDFQEGGDVDILADVHKLSQATGRDRFDGIISCSTFEHIQYPWVACVEIARALRPGGLVFIQTHQSFPIHAYPHDYWRFTTEALETLFCPRAGFELIASAPEFPARILSRRETRALLRAPTYLNVSLLARRVGEPQDAFWA